MKSIFLKHEDQMIQKIINLTNTWLSTEFLVQIHIFLSTLDMCISFENLKIRKYIYKKKIYTSTGFKILISTTVAVSSIMDFSAY